MAHESAYCFVCADVVSTVKVYYADATEVRCVGCGTLILVLEVEECGSSHEHAVKQKMDAAFPDLTLKELSAILSFAKLVRFRARNNNALDSLCRRMFPEFKVQHVKNMTTGWTEMLVNDVLVEEGGE